jgi:hypothetical protein
LVLQGQLLDVQEDGGSEAAGAAEGLREAGEEVEGAEVAGTVEEEGRRKGQGGADEKATEESGQFADLKWQIG